MDQNALLNIRARAHAKLLYAKIHLDELRARGTNGGTDFDRAFQESFLFHLLGAIDAFVIELAAYYSGGLAGPGLTRGSLRDALKKRGIVSAELAELYTLENSEDTWLFHAKAMRDHSTHVSGVPRAYHMGGPNDGKVFLRNPNTGDHVESDVLDAFADWLENMTALLDKLRTTALVTNAL